MKPLRMEGRAITFIAISIGLSVCALDAAEASPITNLSEVDQDKLLEECRHSDYRTYIKCLKRQTRQHHPHHDTVADAEKAAKCMEACRKMCDMEQMVDCDKKCSYCTRRTKEKVQIISEYETECTNENCKPATRDSPSTTNITTNIDIKNFIQRNATERVCIPPYPCFPSLTLVPQLTLGLGLGLGFGHGYDYSYGGFGAVSGVGAAAGAVGGYGGFPYGITSTSDSRCGSPHCVGGK